MSEDAITRPSAGFNRRRVVQGAIWSLPVIAVVVAAPAAAASPTGTKDPTVQFSAPVGFMLAKNGGGAQYAASGPAKFTINSGSSPITGPITGIVTVVPNQNSSPQARGIGIKTVHNPAGQPAVTTDTFAFSSTTKTQADTATTTFTYPAGMGASSTLDLTVTFVYQTGQVTESTTTLTYTATLKLTDSSGVQIGLLAQELVSTRFAPTL